AVSQDPNVASLMASVGGATASSLGGPNYGQLVIHLKPRNQRALGVEGLIKDLRPKLDRFAGMKVYLQNPPTMRIGGQVTKSLYQFSMQSPDKPELYATAQVLEREIAAIPRVQDATSDLQILSPQVNVEIDRDKAGSHQVNAQQIDN